MKLKTTWAITIILLTVFILLNNGNFGSLQFDEERPTFRASMVVADIFIVMAFGVVIGGLVALIPFRKLGFSAKFKFTFPWSSSLLLIFLISVFGYSACFEEMKGVKLCSKETYDKVAPPAGLDCSSIKNGKFEAAGDLIERLGNQQIETNMRSNKKIIYTVEWNGDCEYYLIAKADSTKNMKIKIVAVTDDGYTCYGLPNAGKNTIRYLVKRIREGK